MGSPFLGVVQDLFNTRKAITLSGWPTFGVRVADVGGGGVRGPMLGVGWLMLGV